MTLDQLKKVINKINERLALHGGGIELVNFDERDKIVKIRLQGACGHCPMAKLTSENFIKRELKRELPDLKEIEII